MGRPRHRASRLTAGVCVWSDPPAARQHDARAGTVLSAPLVAAWSLGTTHARSSTRRVRMSEENRQDITKAKVVYAPVNMDAR